MDVSVIVPTTYQHPGFLLDALASVKAQKLPCHDFEILVVDNAPRTTRDLIALCNPNGRPPVRYIHEPRRGLHNARHAGARAARGYILVYIDDDALAPPGWLGAILEPYNDQKVACVGGRTLPLYEREPPEWLSRFHGYLSLLDRGDQIRELRWPEDIYGCNFSIHKSILFKVGGFHPDGFAESDLLWYRGDGETGLLRKVYLAGYKVVYTPHGWLHHRVPANRMTVEYLSQRAFREGFSKGFTEYREKQHPRWRLLLRAVPFFLSWQYKTVMGTLVPGQLRRARYRVSASFCRSRALYGWRLAMSDSLRKYVTRETFLD
ncbi:MAG: glycosyltransferase family 2 protein [Deltaproteobacteria bacterium]|nr:glycosyltransferase family 2 protein [Deltaproteobacteria bacterium]